MDSTNKHNIDFGTVRQIYLEDHGRKKDTWELTNLEAANNKFGSWIYTEIHPNEIAKIVVPHYRFGGDVVNPNTGAFLESAYENFIGRLNHFKMYNSQFCRRFFTQKEIAPTDNLTLFLSQEPLFRGGSYEGLTRFKGHITHLDGFHRLMGLIAAIDERKEIKHSLKACIARYSQ